jgi:cell division protein ZapA
MTKNKTCIIKILNKSYHIKCPESEEQTLQLAVAKLNEKIAVNTSRLNNLDNFQTLLLAALDTAHELVICKNEQEQQRHQVNQFITTLERKINKTVHGDVYPSIAMD